MIRFAANLGFLWADRPLPDAIEAAAAAGFDAVECHMPYAHDPADVAAALARRDEGVSETDLLDRLAADQRLPLDRAALDGLLADPSAFVGNASAQVDAVVERVAEVVAAHPQAAAYDPEPIL